MRRTLALTLAILCAATAADARRHRTHSPHRHYALHRHHVAKQALLARSTKSTPNQIVATRSWPQDQGKTGAAKSRRDRPLVPAGWTAEIVDPFWKGERYRSPGGEASATLYSRSADGERLTDHWKAFVFRPGEDVRHFDRAQDWVVASGLNGDRMFHRKAIYVSDCPARTWKHIELEFPSEESSRFEPVWAGMLQAFEFEPASCSAGETVIQAFRLLGEDTR
jgi:hypothetical protein